MTTKPQRAARIGLSIGAFCLWAYLLIDGRSLDPTTTLAIFALILACVGLGSIIGDIAAVLGGGGGGGSGGGGNE